jgi:hypothetical protein
MKKAIQNIIALALLIIGFTACHKPDEIVGKPHKAKYEVVSVDGTPTKVTLSYITQTGIGWGQGLENRLIDTVTPWQHEFTSYGNFQFLLIGTTNEDYNAEKKHFIERIYLDNQLIAEQQSDEYHGVYLTYSYQE